MIAKRSGAKHVVPRDRMLDFVYRIHFNKKKAQACFNGLPRKSVIIAKGDWRAIRFLGTVY